MKARFPSSRKAYRYDGSYPGFLCCVFESFLHKETPPAILQEEDPCTFYGEKWIETDEERAGRVLRSLPRRISPAAAAFARDVFLTSLPEKELPLLRILQEGFRSGGTVLDRLADGDLHVLWKAVRAMRNEAHLLLGFVRFSDYGGTLVSVITPKNHVLPILASHFRSRMPRESFLIYDRTHREGVLYRPGRLLFLPMESFTPPPPDQTEAEYRALWRRFYHMVAIESRENPKCRASHMPKRYWGNMTEFQDEESSSLPAARQNMLDKKSGGAYDGNKAARNKPAARFSGEEEEGWQQFPSGPSGAAGIRE